MSKHRPIELITDPSSGELSMSRLCLGVMVLGYLPAMVGLAALGVHVGYWAQFALIVGSVAGAYGANSFGRVWREPKEGEAPPTPRVAKPE